MFEVAELGLRCSKTDYRAAVPALRVGLLEAQYALRDRDFPVVVLLAGDNRPACNELLNVLHGWLDTRLIETEAFDAPSDEERERPEFWRYWRALPARGRLGVFLGGWTIRAVRDRLGKRISRVDFERALQRIVRVERALVDDGALVLKFWLHIPKAELKRTLKLARQRPDEAWWIQDVDRRIYKNYDRAMQTVERALRTTSTGDAPWQLVESTDARHRNLVVGRALLSALQTRLDDEPRSGPRPSAAPITDRSDDAPTVLDSIDLTRSLQKPAYARRKKRAQAAIHELTGRARDEGVSSVLVFEGADAAGKGSCIRRLTQAIDARDVRVRQIAAPAGEEREHHYLWRFWHRLPRAGRVAIFDRSWYGRVLVERVEGFASEAAWRRAYAEINEFEEQLAEHGTVLLKFWLHVDEDEQLQRFRAREQIAFKKYKITDEDYRNRKRRRDYDLAASEMIARTSTEFAPWTLVPANDKRWARIQVLETFRRALESRLAGG